MEALYGKASRIWGFDRGGASTTPLKESRYCGCKGNNPVPFAFVRE